MTPRLARLAWLALLALALASARAQNVSERQYFELSPRQPVASGERVEVIEFFYYGCPVCYEAQPQIARWLAKAGANIEYKRVPAVSAEGWDSFARTYYALEATGLLARLHWPLYDNHHFDGRQLNEEKNLLAWLRSNGVDAERFKQVRDSAEISARVDAAQKMLDPYQVRGVPTFVIDGRYVTSARLAGGVDEMVVVIDALVDRARQERRKK